MTQYLAESAGTVVAVEIDKNLLPILEETLADYDNVTVINEDILKLDIQKLVDERNGGKPIKVVANLPYYITTPIIMGLFESHVPVGKYDSDGAERSSGKDAFRPGDKRLRGAFTGRSVLCRPLCCCQCTMQLFYAKTECGFSGYSVDKA